MVVREIKTFYDVFAAYKHKYRLIDKDNIIYDVCNLSTLTKPYTILLRKCTRDNAAQKVTHNFDNDFKLNFKILLN